ncbi:MAG: hypothetical protein JW941_09035 [Candidatus Coatesbacteria bacterium]|nr:hypothetical protein [Candidatus Coatesbacteria bacterium]
MKKIWIRGLASKTMLFFVVCIMIGCFHEADHLNPEGRVAFNYAMDLWSNGDRQGAIAAFNKAGELTSADKWEAFARYCISEIYLEMGDDGNSQAALAAAKAKLGPLYEVVAAAGECFWELDLLEDARIEFRKALKGGLGGERRVEISYELGMVCTELGYLDEAQAQYRHILNPQFPKAYRGYAILLDRMGRRSDANENWRLYLEHDPNGEFADEARRRLGM